MDISDKYIFLSMALLLTALPLYYKLVPPNHFYGFKEKRLLENRIAWYTANKFFGLQIMKCCLFLTLLSMVIPLVELKILNNHITIFILLIATAVFTVKTTMSFVNNYFDSKS